MTDTETKTLTDAEKLEIATRALREIATVQHGMHAMSGDWAVDECVKVAANAMEKIGMPVKTRPC